MNMKKVTLVQPNYGMGFKMTNGKSTATSFYLPYSLGVLWSYVSKSEIVKNNFQLDHVIWRRNPVEETAQKLQDQDIVGFSTYAWNKNYNLTLAKRIRELNPNVLIIFGGPEPAIEDPDFFRKNPFINIVVVREGEITFQRILENLNDFSKVPGLIINVDLESVNTGPAERISDIDIIPSPYTTGFFDKIMQAEENQGLTWTATLETNRGCPYQCTFCDWGSLTYSKVKKFSLERVIDEIEWVGKNKIEYISFADANFGMFVERDNIIIDHYLDVQRRYGYPKSFVTSYAKNQRREVLDIVEKVLKNSIYPNQGLHVSLQTLNENSLGVVKRKNLKINDCEGLFRDAEARGVPIGTELILGLPGETLKSWKENYTKLFDMNLHAGIDTFVCQLLENAELNTVQRKIYNIKTSTIYDYLTNTSEDHISESLEVVRSTADMSEDDMIKGLTWVWYMAMSHMGGFTNFISRFLVTSKITTYLEFYEGLFQHLLKSTWFQESVKKYTGHINHWYDHGRSDCEVVGMHLEGWRLHYMTLMQVHADVNLLDQYRNDVDAYLNQFELDEITRKDLQTLQFQYIINHQTINEYPKTISLQTNMYDFIVLNKPFTKTPTKLTFDYVDDRDIDLTEFLQKLHFRRRRNFGKAWIRRHED